MIIPLLFSFLNEIATKGGSEFLDLFVLIWFSSFSTVLLHKKSNREASYWALLHEMNTAH